MPWQPFFYKIALVKQTDKNRQTRTKMKRKTKTGCHIMDEQLIKSLWMPRKYLLGCQGNIYNNVLTYLITRMSNKCLQGCPEIFTRMARKYLQGCPEIFTRMSRVI